MRGPQVESSGISGALSARARPWIATSAAAVGWGTFTMVILHVVSGYNPITDTLSSYAYTEQGDGMLEASVLSLAIGSLVLIGALLTANLPIRGTPAFLLVLWAGGLSSAAMFPASFIAHPAPATGEIHQWSCVIAFLSLPGAGFALADRMRTRPELHDARRTVLKLSLLSAATLVLFGISYVLLRFPDVALLESLSDALPVGFTQRVALAADLVLLAGLLRVATKVARSYPAQPQQEAA